MTLVEFKKLVNNKDLPTIMVWVDMNHTLVEHYLESMSQILNRRIEKAFSAEELVNLSYYSEDPENVIYLSYLSKREVDKVIKSRIEGPAIYVIVVDEEEIKVPYEKIVFGDLSRNACLLYLENYVKIKKTSNKNKESGEGQEEYSGHLSRETLEKLVDYFDNNLDRCLNEIKKVEVLELQGSWEKPFSAIFECLPKKDDKMRSLKWFSGGDIDTCQVLYNIYIKKLRSLVNSTREEQELWSRLVKEAIWCEACIVSGLIGDYVVDYLKLVERSLPGDFRVEYYPPVFYDQLKNSPEWGL